MGFFGNGSLMKDNAFTMKMFLFLFCFIHGCGIMCRTCKKGGVTRMKESIYLNDDLAIVNFNKAYPKNGEVFLTSSTFSNFMRTYIEHLKNYDEDLYIYALQGKSGREATFEM